MPPAKPLFILGIGAQKCGTTWLHSYLSKAPHVDMGCAKEYHVWDALYGPEPLHWYRQDRVDDATARTALRWAMQTVEGAYEAYFKSLVTGRTTTTGDITPTYCALDNNAFLRIKARLEAAGFDVKVVFLMRDPVERCWSVLRKRAMTKRANGIPFSDAHLIDEFARLYASPNFDIRTRYDRTLTALDAAFDPKDVYVGLYEEMFDAEPLTALSEFLAVPVIPDLAQVRIHASPTAPLPAALRDACVAHYAPTYAYCHERFAKTRTLWSAPVAD